MSFFFFFLSTAGDSADDPETPGDPAAVVAVTPDWVAPGATTLPDPTINMEPPPPAPAGTAGVAAAGEVGWVAAPSFLTGAVEVSPDATTEAGLAVPPPLPPSAGWSG